MSLNAPCLQSHKPMPTLWVCVWSLKASPVKELILPQSTLIKRTPPSSSSNPPRATSGMNAPQALKQGHVQRFLTILFSITQNVCGRFLVFVFDDIREACFSVVLPQCPTVFAYQSAFDILLSWLGLDLILPVFVCMCHSGGRTITVTGQGFDLVQSATMQVEGVGHTVSHQLCSFHQTCGKLVLNRAKMQTKLFSLS